MGEDGVDKEREMHIRRAELQAIESDQSDLIGYYEVEIYGLLSTLNGHDLAVAHFGTFERIPRAILYSATVWAEDGEIFHDFDSEFCDDLRALTDGNVTLLD